MKEVKESYKLIHLYQIRNIVDMYFTNQALDSKIKNCKNRDSKAIQQYIKDYNNLIELSTIEIEEDFEVAGDYYYIHYEPDSKTLFLRTILFICNCNSVSYLAKYLTHKNSILRAYTELRIKDLKRSKYE